MIDFSKKPLFLAPLAGFTDPPFRDVVKRFQADITVSEMISSNALSFKNKKTLKMVEKASSERPYIVQIAGGDVESIKRAISLLNHIDGIDGIDLNCGCPAPKVANNNQGSSLLKDLDRLKLLLETIKSHSNKRYTSAKVRIGFNSKIPVEIAKCVESAGADFICVHGRLRSDGYKKERIDYGAIRDIKRAVDIPVVANGEIDSSNAREVLEFTGADGLMIGRSSIGRPWIFREIKDLGFKISDEEKRDALLMHLERSLEHYGEFGVVIFRKHLHAYSKGRDESSAFRDKINRISDPKELKEAIFSFF